MRFFVRARCLRGLLLAVAGGITDMGIGHALLRLCRVQLGSRDAAVRQGTRT